MSLSRREFLGGAAAFAALPQFAALAEGTNCIPSSASSPIRRSDERQCELLTKWNEATEAVSPQVYGQYLRDGYTRSKRVFRIKDVEIRTSLIDHNDYLIDFTTAFEIRIGGKFILYHTSVVFWGDRIV